MDAANDASDNSHAPAEVILLQSVAVVDHLCTVDEQTAVKLAEGALGGSRRCTAEQLQQLLAEVGEFTCRAGGSASNVARGLSTGFGVATAMVGACGTDEWGAIWQASMTRSGVCTRQMCKVPGSTGRSAVLLAAGERTCRTYLDPAVTFPGEKLQPHHIQGASWLFLSGYASYQDGLLPKAVSLAKELGIRVALDLGSWEIVSQHWQLLESVLHQGVDLCFCNEEEAKGLCNLMQLPKPGPEAALRYLLTHCTTAVVTLGPHGCLAGTHAGSICSSSSGRLSSSLSIRQSSKMVQQQQDRSAVPDDKTDEQDGQQQGQLQQQHEDLQQRALTAAHEQLLETPCQQEEAADVTDRGEGDSWEGLEIVRQPGVAGVKVVDVTGAGDMFAAGFLHGMLRGWSLQRCAEAACLSGAAAVQVLGADVGRTQLHWMHQRLLGPHAASVLANAAGQVAREQLAAYGLVEKIGRGVVYFGSARVRHDHPMYHQTRQLAAQVAGLLDVPTWTGGGPGLMQAATEGAMSVGGVVGGIRIAREAGAAVLSGAYLPEDSQVMCHHLSTRKSGLVQAGCRRCEDDCTAFVFLPGGLGTMDELFELLTLMQLRKLPQQIAAAMDGPAAKSSKTSTGSSSSSGGGGSDGFVSPVMLVDYDGFYQGFVTFLQACEQHGMLRSQELSGVVVASSNAAVLKHLAEYYSIPLPAELANECEALDAKAVALLALARAQ